MSDLEELSELLQIRNAIDTKIAKLINRPVAPGHVGEYVAKQIFGIHLHEGASTKGSDGSFPDGVLAGGSVNVKWSLKQDGLLNFNKGEPPGYYLVFKGPKEAPGSSLGKDRPWVIDLMYLFDGTKLHHALAQTGVNIGIATHIAKELWTRAEIFPNPNSPLLVLTEKQRAQVALFGSQHVTGNSD